MRAKPTNLVLVNAAPFGSAYVYHDTVSLDVVLGDEFFLPVRNQLRPGDDLSLRRTGKGNDGEVRVIEIAEIVVTDSSRSGVSLVLKPGYPMEVSDPSPEPSKEVYLSEGHYVTNAGSAGFAVRDPDKNIVFRTTDEVLARNVAEGAVPVPA